MTKTRKYLHQSIRVNHAGERAAVMIYEGQLDGCRDVSVRKELASMLAGERVHLQYFRDVMRSNKVRPTLFLPVWDAMSYGLGYITGRLGVNAAMTCTAAVESAIIDHYKEQEQNLTDNDNALRDRISEFRRDEEKHKTTAERYANSSGSLLHKAINCGCRAAIFLTKRL